MDTSRLRNTYERVQSIFPGSVISTQVLRSERALQSNRSEYTFQLKQGNTSTDGPLENLLADTDAFVLLGLSIGIIKYDPSKTPAWVGTYQLFTAPDPQYFVGTSSGKPEEWEALLALYTGKLSFRTGSLERVRPTDTSDFLTVPQTQVVKQASPLINDGLSQFGGWDMESRGYMEQQPCMLLDGTQQNQFSLLLGPGDYTTIDGSWVAAGTQTATTRNKVVLRAFGLLIANGAEPAKKFASSWSL